MQLQIREARTEDAEGLLSVYRRFAKEHVGLASRDMKAFRRLLRRKENLGWVALTEKGNLIGYVTARFDEKAREARIREIVVDPSYDFVQVAVPLAEKAHDALLEKKPAVISVGSIRNRHYAEIFPQLGFFEMESTGVFMYALVDIPRFLREISPVLASRVGRLIHWNGLLQLECEGHCLYIRKHEEDVETLIWANQKPDFEISLGRETLVKLLFGTVDSMDLFKKQQLKVETGLSSEETSEMLAAVFPGKQFVIMDFW